MWLRLPRSLYGFYLIMARLSRLYAPQIPQLVQAEFAQPLAAISDPTPAATLDQLQHWLRQEAKDHKLALHGWLLLNDRITLLATPPEPQSLSKVIQALGRRMAAGMRHGRVFTGRYRSALIEPGRWVLPTLVWLESLPVHLGYVDHAEYWPWSSVAGHIGKHPGGDPSGGDPLGGTPSGGMPLVTDHNDYWQDGNTPFARQAKYRERLSYGLTPAQRRRIEQALFGQWVLGETDFLAHLQPRASRRIAPAPRGRPRKAPLDASPFSD
jgi:putative transposase